MEFLDKSWSKWSCLSFEQEKNNFLCFNPSPPPFYISCYTERGIPGFIKTCGLVKVVTWQALQLVNYKIHFESNLISTESSSLICFKFFYFFLMQKLLNFCTNPNLCKWGYFLFFAWVRGTWNNWH